MMRFLLVVAAAWAGTACSPAAVGHGEGEAKESAETVDANAQQASMTATTDFLLASAAADFHAHPPAEALRVHDVRIAYSTNPDGSRRYMLCGYFSSASGSGQVERTPFVTVDSPGGPNGYQQMLGETGRCDERSATFPSASDLSASLQSRLDAR